MTDEPKVHNEVARIRLLEERPEVRLERVAAGSVLLRREVETRRETVEIELTTETLVIRHEAASGQTDGVRVEIEGQTLEPGQEVRIVLYREAPEVRKVVVVHEDVQVFKQTQTETQSVAVELGREVLRVDTRGDVKLEETDDSGPTR